mmetsp:Transcript_58234/g.107256  ORF Transcript_58234/g.107256 Transcript_58234/m.107256 type:complete len:83 (-) Transcript_58234:222-470(-)
MWRSPTLSARCHAADAYYTDIRAEWRQRCLGAGPAPGEVAHQISELTFFVSHATDFTQQIASQTPALANRNGSASESEVAQT